MADDALQVGDAAEIEVGAPEMAWSQVWQMPVLLLGLGLLAVGVYFALPKYVPMDYDKELAKIESLVTKNRLEEAEGRLIALSETDDFVEAVDDPVEGYYWQLYGDLRFRQLDTRVWQGITTEAGQENLGQIVEFYRKSQKLGHEMPGSALWRYAQALAAMGDDTGALGVVDQMPEDSATRRHEIVRKLVERAIQTDPDPASEKVANLLRRFEAELESEPDVAVRRGEKIWAMQQRAELSLRAKDEQAVIRMLVEGGLMRLRQGGASDEDIAPLNVLLGEAYAMEENFADARHRFSEARDHLEEGHALFPRVLVGFADIELAQSEQGYIERAFGLYHQAYLSAPQGPSSIDAKIGEAHTEAYREDRFVEALEAFEVAAERLATEQAPVWDPRREKLEHYLGVHIAREYENRQYENALALLKVVEPLTERGDSAALARQFAETYRHLGEQAEQAAKALEPDPARPEEDPHLAARRMHHQEAAVYFEQAAEAYLREAKLLEAETDGHGVALWAAGEHFAKAQLWEKAVAVYQDFLATRGDSGKREEAMFRLGQAYLADREYGAARDQLRALIESTDTSQWAMRSYVPLSRALVGLDEWDQAEQWLRFVVEDHRAIGPDSPFFRDALIELGTLYYRRGSLDDTYYARGIEVLGDAGGAVERYAMDRGDGNYVPEMEAKLRYMLADCLRLSAMGLGRQAAEAPNQSDRLAMQAERVRRLSEAKMYYQQVQELLDDRHPSSLSRVERVYHRNAYFYQADCAFEQSDFANAILLYQDAAMRWQDHPASLVAWVQIVNSAAEMKDYPRARAAHRQAVEVFSKLDDSVFEHPDSLMTRQRWDDWLRWSTELDLYPEDNATAGVDTGN
ncbi:MAG: tol-pal system YbgF family protein [Phycisphaerales bacterium JB063]